jgi:hypothetical protein
MNGKFQPRTEVEPSRAWLAMPIIAERQVHRAQTTWATRLTWFAIGCIVALILRGL